MNTSTFESTSTRKRLPQSSERIAEQGRRPAPELAAEHKLLGTQTITSIQRGTTSRRQRLRDRYLLRTAHGYEADTADGQIGRVVEIDVAPFEFWPETLVVAAPSGQLLRIPAAWVERVLSRERRLILSQSPAAAQPVARPAQPLLDRQRIWRIVAAVGAASGLGGYIAALVAFASGVTLEAAPLLTSTGAIAVCASGLAWANGRRSWLAAAGLGSFWLPLGVGTILTLARIF
jgi:hypothetical protein